MNTARANHSVAVPIDGPDVIAALGPLEVSIALTEELGVWSVANRSDLPLQIRSVSLVFALVDTHEPVRMFRNGYQSWSPTGVATFGVDVDPSSRADFEFVQATQHADQHRAFDGELRSEWVTLLADGGSLRRAEPILVGFDMVTK